MARRIDRRLFLGGAVGAAAAGLTGYATLGRQATANQVRKGTTSRVLEAVESEIDIGGKTVNTWTYGDLLPGKELRTRAGDTVEVRLKNRLPEPTSTHWHGLRIVNSMDGVPGVTQSLVQPGDAFHYRFTPPDPGTFWFHAHHHLQLDRGLYAPLIVEDPNEPGDYDHEWVIVLDDWVDGTGRTPEDVYHHLKEGHHHGEDYDDPCLDYLGMHVGDVSYPYYLINGRSPADPTVFSGKPGDRVRLRIINAAADTLFRVALGGHTLRATHTDGFPVKPREGQSVLLGMAERIDAVVELDAGVFPLVAKPEGKDGEAFAVVRAGGGRTPELSAQPSELEACPIVSGDLVATDDVILDGPVDRTHDLVLTGDMMSYTWKINGETFGNHTPLPVTKGEGVLLRYTNQTMMPHPMHLHGHTFQVRNADGGFGPRKDTLIVPMNKTIEVYFVADNPGDWVTHCHNEYHMTSGMMTTIEYQS